ncbi:MAG TPA: TonB-dependent receptor [Steroidobacteraceae bacterium]|nr:TonB-dependent receptor [Steroidobacteraceae bacterium]
MRALCGVLFAAGVVGQGLTTAVRAETTDDNNPQALEEVVVTSQRRTERLQDVPISVSAFSQAAMDTQGMRSIDDVARLTPGVTFSHGTNSNSESSTISIRGIASSAGAATTGVYVDDTPIQSRHLSFAAFNAWPVLFDIDRVEVLRGPQGTLFGAGSEGGTIRFITPEPGLHDYSMYARSEIASTEYGAPTYEAGVAGGGPLIDGTLGFRASVSYRREGGYVDRVDWHTGETVDANSNWNRTTTARLAVKWVPSDDVSVTPSFYYQTRYVNDTSAYWSVLPGSADPTGGQFDTPFKNGNALANPSTDRFMLPAIKVDWNLGAVSLTSNTSYFKRDESAVTDYTQYDRAVFIGSPYPPASSQAPTYWADNQKNFTQEVRLQSTDPRARVSWTAGLFYQRADENSVENVYDPSLPADFDNATGVPGLFTSIFGPLLNGYIYKQDPYRGVDKQIAGFGQASVGLTDALKLTLGLRYAKADFHGSTQYAGPVVGTPVSSTGSLSEHPATPKAGLDYQLTPDNLLYVSAAKGYRIGGSNAKVGVACEPALAAIGLTDVPATYGSDSVWSYEVGSKNVLADRRLLIDASAYLIKWNNIQQWVYLSSCGFPFTANLGKAESRGFDLQTRYSFPKLLTVGATFGYTDAHYTQTVQLQGAASSIVQDGDHIAGSPWTLAVFGQLDFPALGKQGYVRMDYEYDAQQTDKVPNQDPANGTYAKYFASVPVQSFASLRAGLKWSGLDISVFSQNLFNTRPRLTSTEDVGTPTGGTPLFYDISWRPRTVGVTMTYHY